MPSLHPNRSSSTHNNNENNRLSSSSSSQPDNNRPGLFERLKWQNSSKKRKNESTSSSETTASDSRSPFNLALRLRALLDSHPVNSPAPRFQPLPTPDESPTLSPASPLSPVIPDSPLPIQNYDPLPFSPALSTSELLYRGSSSSFSPTSSPTTYFSAQPGADADLVALLSSPEFMNGSLPLPMSSTQLSDPLQTPGTFSPAPIMPGSPGPSAPILRSPGRRQSVFSILDRIGSPKARAKRLGRQVEEVPRGSNYPASPRGGLMTPEMSSISSVLASRSAQATYGSDVTRDMDTEDDSVEDGDDTSIMLYSPLMPTATSLVSIADSEMVPVVAVPEEEESDNEEERTGADAAPLASEVQAYQQPETSKSGWSWSNVLSFSWWSSSSNEASSSSATASTQPAAASTSQVQDPEPQSTPARVRRRRVWVPSRTQLSLETTWWGYRIYIPPPILETLDITSTETNRRAALLTAALTWFFTHFPVHVLPPTVRPVILILQGLVPYLGYLGGLLSWSWGTIRAYDEGYGIILTATWLLPIALIPSTWVPPDWPGSPLSPSSGATVNPLSPASQSTPVPLPLSSPLPSPQPPAQPQQFSPAQEFHQVEHQPFPVYSPYSHTSMLSPLPQQFGFSSVPAPNASPHEHYGTAPLPVMAMSMMTPATMYSPMVAPSPSSPGSYLSMTPSTLASLAMYTAPTSPCPLPLATSSAMETTTTATATRKRRTKRGDGRRRTKGSLNAPRIATVPLPGDEM